MGVLVVAAHPDDEILGCGATLARLAQAGETVDILILGEGAASRRQEDAAKEIAKLSDAAAAAAETLGARSPKMAGFPDNRLDTLPLLDVIQEIEAVVGAARPDTVFTHHGGDLNVDHRIAHEATVTACRPLPGSTVRRLYAFETVSSSEYATRAVGEAFRPNRFVDVSAFMDHKKRAIDCYAFEMRAFPHPRSWENIVSLAKLRGAQSGLAAAEAFEVLLDIETGGAR